MRAQVYVHDQSIFDQTFDICQILSKKNGGDLVRRFVVNVFKTAKGIDFSCPVKAVSFLFFVFASS